MKRILLTVIMISLALGTVAAQNAKQHITKGQEHMKTQNYAEAAASFDAALKLQPKNKQAADLLKQAQEKRTEQIMNQAQRLFQEGNFTEAIVQYRAAQRSMPPGYKGGSQIASRLTEAQRALEDQQNQAQEQTAREKAELAKKSIEKANDHFLAGNYEDAIAEYDNAEKIGGLTSAEVTEAHRLTELAKEFMSMSDSAAVSRPLSQDDFDFQMTPASPTPATNYGGVTILRYKGVQTKTVTIAGKSHAISYGIKEVVIPQRLGNQNVTIIAKDAFKDTGITKVTIPTSVREIHVGAFANNNLNSVTILQAANPRAEGLVVIKGGDLRGAIEVAELGAFENNPALESITIPNSVTEIGARAFKDCGLKFVDLGTTVREIGESAFRNNQIESIKPQPLQPSLLVIRRFAFHDNKIISLTLNTTLDVIYANAFTNNPMTSLIFPPGGKWTSEYRLPTMTVPRIGGDYFLIQGPASVFPIDTITTIQLPANMISRNLELFDPNLKVYYENRPPAGTNRAVGTYTREMSGTTSIWSKR